MKKGDVLSDGRKVLDVDGDGKPTILSKLKKEKKVVVVDEEKTKPIVADGDKDCYPVERKLNAFEKRELIAGQQRFGNKKFGFIKVDIGLRRARIEAQSLLASMDLK